jgi:hypothetical protein
MPVEQDSGAHAGLISSPAAPGAARGELDIESATADDIFELPDNSLEAL